jgi:hypothetical protein
MDPQSLVLPFGVGTARLRVTRPATVGRVYTMVARGTKRPRTTRLCLNPGATKPTACPI